MSVVRFIGCLHLRHNNMALRRGFQDMFEHDECLIKNWNHVVKKRDLVYILGDVTMENSKHYSLLNELNGEKVVVLGNHDKWQHVPELLKYVNGVAGMIDYKGCALTHAPIHPNEMGWYRANIHAHIHHTNILNECIVLNSYQDLGSVLIPTRHKYKNVDAKLIGYQPKTLEELNLF